VKVAAAVLGASLLFFLGVLTGAGRSQSVPAPGVITLGVVQPANPAGPVPAPRTAKTSPTATATSKSSPSTATTSRSAASTTTATAGSAVTTAPTGPTSDTAPPTEPTATSTTAPPGQVEPVDNQVDCAQTGKGGNGHRTPCPSTTTTSTTSATSATSSGNAGGGEQH
jgi:hypothetical protein